MTKVFIGGSRRITRLSADVRRRLDNIIRKRLRVLIGDANGTDKAVQEYFSSKSYDLVEVFCAGTECRNNIGGWPIRVIPTRGRRRDFNFFATKDRAMAIEASVGFMVWDGKSIGTLMNVQRLAAQTKKVVVYVTPQKRFANVKSEAELERLVARYTPDLLKHLEHTVTLEEQALPRPGQANLL